VILCGVDEAGKGAVLGPLVVAAVGCRREEDLAVLGVKDSKELSPHQREALAGEIRRSFPVAVLSLSPAEIDGRGVGLNTLIARSHADVISMLAPSVAVIDACDVNASRYGEMVTGFLSVPCRVVSCHHADRLHPAVSAASIVAKVERDSMIHRLHDEWGPFGSGYPSDPVTIRFLERYFREKGEIPSIARRSWETTRTLIARAEQKDLLNFL
jgi:ribonuclease HII